MILIAEDNSGMRRMIRSLVEDIDPDIVECEDGTSAIEAYDLHHPDAVLMDVSMKPMDGLTATKKIMELNPNALIIVFTQLTDSGTREAAIRSGASGFVSKDDLTKLRAICSERQPIAREEREE